MQNITTFRQLILWQKSMDLAVRSFELARTFPRTEQPVLGYQIRKSAVSLPSNVAEGFSRHSTSFYIQHLWTAHASGAELETQLEIGRRIEIVTEPDAELLIADAQEVARMINGLVRSLRVHFRMSSDNRAGAASPERSSGTKTLHSTTGHG